MNLLQILEKVATALPGIIVGVEHAMAGMAGTAKKDEALKGVGEVLDGIASAGVQVAKTTFLAVASDLVDAYVGAANAIGAFQHQAQER